MFVLAVPSRHIPFSISPIQAASDNSLGAKCGTICANKPQAVGLLSLQRPKAFLHFPERERKRKRKRKRKRERERKIEREREIKRERERDRETERQREREREREKKKKKKKERKKYLGETLRERERDKKRSKKQGQQSAEPLTGTMALVESLLRRKQKHVSRDACQCSQKPLSWGQKKKREGGHRTKIA